MSLGIIGRKGCYILSTYADIISAIHPMPDIIGETEVTSNVLW